MSPDPYSRPEDSDPTYTLDCEEPDIWVTGVDGSPEAVVEMTTAGSPFWATPAQDPAGMVLKSYEIGKQIVESGAAPAERAILMSPTLITQENVAEYPGW